MKTIALRFADNFAPEGGTIKAHERLIREHGFVWYGKLGAAISSRAKHSVLDNDNPKILLIHSGTPFRYWAFVEDITRDLPDSIAIPKYCANMSEKFGCWFKITRFEEAEKTVMSQFVVTSSGKVLTEASRRSMSPYFIIESREKE